MRRRGIDVIVKPAIIGKDGKISRYDIVVTHWNNYFVGRRPEAFTTPEQAINYLSKTEIGNRFMVNLGWKDQPYYVTKNRFIGYDGHISAAEMTEDGFVLLSPQNRDNNCINYFTLAAEDTTIIKIVVDL